MINSSINKKKKSNNNIYSNNKMSKVSSNLNKTVINNQLEDLKALLKSERDTLIKNKKIDEARKLPKLIKKGGKFTNKFLTWNRKMLNENKTLFYADTSKYYDPITKKFKKVGINKRFKKEKVYDKKTTERKLKASVPTDLIEQSNNKEYIRTIFKQLRKLKGKEKVIVDLKKMKFSSLIKLIQDKMPINKKFVSRSVDGKRWITFSQNNLMKLESINKLTSQENGSDVEYVLDSIKNNGLIEISLVDLDKGKKQKPAGEFFKYYNLTKFNLERYDIYQTKQKEYKDNCLFVALKNSGKVNEMKLNEIRTYFKNGLMPTSKLTEISNILEIQISLNKNSKICKFGKKENPIIKIGLIDEHYILDEPTNITSYSLKNYNEIKDIENFESIYKKDKNGKYKKSNNRGISSLLVVRHLLQNTELIEKIPLEHLMDTQFYGNEIETDNLGYNDSVYIKDINENGNLKVNEVSKTDNSEYYKVFYDFETNTTGEKHEPYLMAFRTEKRNDRQYKGCMIGRGCGYEFIKFLKDIGKYEKKILLIAHNQRYDLTFLLDYLQCINPLLKGNRLMGGSARLYIKKGDFIEIKFQDSLNLIPERLSKFGKMFNLEQEKEIMPYDLYTSKNIEETYVNIDECLKQVKEKDKDKFLENCKKWGCIEDDEINIILYSKKYCEMDVDVLYHGYFTFKKNIKKITKLDISNYCSIASLSHDFMISKGAFDDCYALSGVPRAFIQKCVVGGRCMVRRNEKCYANKDVADYDGVSLYPSSMSRINGYMKGSPKVIQNKSLEFLQKQDYYFVKVVCLNNPTTERNFPVLSKSDENGIRDFTNDTKGAIFYLDKISLEDAVNFQGLKFEIIQGYYYNEGFNNKVNSIINYLFNERLKMKKIKNPIEKVYKLIMNSCYGKCLLKPITDEIEIVYKNKWDDYLTRNYNFIKEYTELEKCVIVKKIKPISKQFNNVNQGVYILSMSKRIMNEVMYCAEDNDCEIYYTDTDSIHIDYDKVAVLEKKFKEKYKRELTGKNLGQFHIDFDLEGSKGEIISKRSVYLGKKCYMDDLKSKDEKGNDLYGEHLRMKGIPAQSIEYTKNNLNVSYHELYMKLYNGEKIKFDLLCGGQRCNFQYNKDLSVRSLGYINGESEFTRELCF